MFKNVSLISSKDKKKRGKKDFQHATQNETIISGWHAWMIIFWMANLTNLNNQLNSYKLSRHSIEGIYRCVMGW